MSKVLFADSLHIHKKNFPNLINLLENSDITYLYVAEENNLKSLYGNYTRDKVKLLNHYDNLKNLSQENLFKTKYYGINLFKLAKAEMLSYLLSKENWYSNSISSNDLDVFNKAFSENRDELLLNMSAVLFWLEFWKKRLGFQNYKDIKYSILFSGSLIYQKSLMYLLENTPIKVFIVEHFFTGNDYYFEEKYTHIANNSDIKFNNFYKILKKSFDAKDSIEKSYDVNSAIKKIIEGKNKNVLQPVKDSNKILFNNNKKNILIIGQVINDFSILETDLENINSLNIYINLINLILMTTEYNVIFKAHPWEKLKINLKRSLTKDFLTDYVYEKYSKEDRKRFLILEDFNINQLINNSEYVVGICSQGLLEATFIGKKVHQIGKAFFGNRGFTYDHKNENEFIQFIKNNNIESNLNLQDYDSFLEYIAIVLENHLINIQDKENNKLKKLLSIVIINKKIKNKQTTIPKIDHSDKVLKKRFIQFIVKIFSSEKKFKKFNSHPKKFFRDSESLIVRLIGIIYEK